MKGKGPARQFLVAKARRCLGEVDAPPPPLSTTLFQRLAQRLMWEAAERGREGRKANIDSTDVAARSGGAAGP